MTRSGTMAATAGLVNVPGGAGRGQGSARSDATQAIVELCAVRFSWSPATAAVIDIDSLSIARGERVLLRGPSGSGKSTLLNLLAGVLVPQAGTVRVMGTDLGKLGGAERDRLRADHIGYLFQVFNLIPYLSVLENVCLPCGFSERRRTRASQEGGSVQDAALRLLERLDMHASDLVRRPVTSLSIGQQQRVAAARALIGAPELLIADEPTSALDADRRTAFVELLFEQCARDGTTLIVASHDASLGAIFDRTIDLATCTRSPAAALAGKVAQ